MAGETQLKDSDGETLLHTDGAEAIHDDCCCASTDCTDCAANCDGGDIAISITGNCTVADTLARIGVCQWRVVVGAITIDLYCGAGNLWAFHIWSNENVPDCEGNVMNPSLLCSGDHPTGSFNYPAVNGDIAVVLS